MTITRNVDGKEAEFELSRHELWQAFEEQQHIFDVDDVDIIISEMNEDPEYYGTDIVLRLAEHMDEIAYEKRRQMDKYGLDWREAVDEAVNVFIRKLKSEEK